MHNLVNEGVYSLPGVMNNLSSKKLGQLLMLSLMCEPEGKQEWSERQEPQNETQRTKWYEHSAIVVCQINISTSHTASHC